MKKQKAYKFRLYPNLEQRIFFEKTFGCSRFIWNQILADRIAHYEETGESLRNTPAQYKSQFPWLKEVDSLALSNVCLNLNAAYKSFFQSKFGFPNFKSKKATQSYRTNNQKGTIALLDGKIKLPKIGWVKVKAHRQIKGVIKSATISRNWQVGFSDTNYGMLVLISVKERKIRTEVSNNMGAIIPDSTAQNLNDSIKDDFRNEDYSSGMLNYLSKVETIIKSSLLESKQNVEKDEYLSKEFVEQLRKEEKEYDRKQGRIGAIIAGVSILIFIFIGIKIEKLQKEEEEYYKWKKKYPSSSSGSGSISYRSASRSYDSFSSSSSSSSYDSSSSSSSSSSWSGGGFDGGGSSGSW